MHIKDWKIVLVGCLIILLSPLFGQKSDDNATARAEIKGTPRIIHYTRKDFSGDPQIWAMCQDNDGIMYFGNNDGTLIFDGARWQTVSLPNNSSVRSLLHTTDGHVYAGGFNEFGRIERDEYGHYSYHSLIDQLSPEDRNLENIWAIHEVQNHIVFRSLSRLVAISNNKAFTIPSTGFYHSAVINDKLYLVNGEGVKTLDLQTLSFESLVAPSQFNQETIVAMVEGTAENQVILFTRSGASYTIDHGSKNIHFFKSYFTGNSNNQILSAIKSSAGHYYLGTLSSQIMVLDEHGDPVPLTESFMELQDNTVLNLSESSEGNIWALLNNGIDCINISSPISVLFENASVFDAMIRGGKIYAATNQGVFVSQRIVQNPHFASMEFRKIPGLEGQAWSLLSLHGQILCSHNDGLFVIDDNNILKIEGLAGVWKVIPIRGKDNHYFVCTYTGIHMLRFENGKFELLYRVDGFNESSRDIIQSDEENTFWVCHGYKGVFKLQFDRNFERVVGLEHFREKGLPSPFSINVFRWNDHIVFTTNQGVYTFNETSNQFDPMTELNERFGTDVNVRKLLQYEDKTWFVQDDEAGFFQRDSKKLEKGLFLELKGTFNRSMESILPINTSNVLIGTTTGLYAYDLSFQQHADTKKTLITEVNYQDNGERTKRSLKGSSEQIPHSASDLRFEFSAPKLKDQTQVQYSHMLEGIDEDWSDWSVDPFKNYSQLFPGKYTFKVKARSMIGETTSESSYHFTIAPIWYMTRWAIGAYVLMILLIMIGSRKLVKKKIVVEKEKTREEEKKKRTVLELELDQMRLEREKERIERDKKILEEDVIFKSKELANYTMLLVKKRELLTDLREDLKELKEVAKNERSRNMLRNLIRKIGVNLNDEEHIHVFEANFERVHDDFFQELKTYFPDLTSKELRLCALVKMNLTNKEIAPILNISLRGVETARYRLRKRLSLDHEENMVEFLEKLSP
ncbi:triple tyrosine motif-containing protein [Marinoscillum luteum]|uniref:Triple tyrosine motif-containing protein n=1 Tax=Marinoscillum luteum TaxID=861051 RepID=A0ABW7NBK1_9BACT